jgi:FAD/FMN-containing dehydrogenase
MDAAAADRVRAALVERLGRESVVVSPEDRRLASADASRMFTDCLAVVRPKDEGEVVALVKAAHELGFTIVPRGAGTSPTGSAAAGAGQVVVDLSRMDRILAVDARDLVAEVEPGVLCGALQARCEEAGLFYPPDPASSRVSTLGGNVATGAGGLRAVKYGVTRDYVLGVRAVLGDGSILDVGGRALKSVVGYDLVRLMVGSEGTLGIFTKLTLKLLPKPESAETLVADFAAVDGAYRGADAVLAAGVLPRALEAMDGEVAAIVADYLGEAADPTLGSRLLVEVDGDREAAARDADRALAALKAAGGDERAARGGPGGAREALARAAVDLPGGLSRVAGEEVGRSGRTPQQTRRSGRGDQSRRARRGRARDRVRPRGGREPPRELPVRPGTERGEGARRADDRPGDGRRARGRRDDQRGARGGAEEARRGPARDIPGGACDHARRQEPVRPAGRPESR